MLLCFNADINWFSTTSENKFGDTEKFTVSPSFKFVREIIETETLSIDFCINDKLFSSEKSLENKKIKKIIFQLIFNLSVDSSYF